MATLNRSGNAAPFSSPDGEVKDGANHFMLLLDRVREISNSTVDRFGEHQDGRDYVQIAEEVEQAMRQHLLEAADRKREGFLRALCDFVAVGADGCCVSYDWDPLSTTAAAFSAEGASS